MKFYTYTIHVWYIYLHLPYFAIKNQPFMFGLYTVRPMDGIGKPVNQKGWWFQRFFVVFLAYYMGKWSNSHRIHVSNEKRALGWLGYIGDEILPSYIGILTSHYKDPY